MNAAVLQPVEQALTQKIHVKNLNFYYGKFQALKSINLEITERKVTAFIGPSGCGKSTLLRTFNRMYALYPNQEAQGEILLDGENILDPSQDLNRLRAKVGMVFQKPTPFPMSIHDNIAFGIRLYERMPRSELDDRIESALRRAALWDEVKDKLRQSGLSLSGRQLHRHRHAQHAAGGTQLGLHRLHVSRRADRVRRDRAHLHPPGAEADRRLHHWSVRLSRVAENSTYGVRA